MRSSLTQTPCSILAAGTILLLASSVFAQSDWVAFEEATSTRLVTDPIYVDNDNIEKDFAWGDVNKDGWVDLVVVRKFPGSIEGGARNLLFLNREGVLVDSTDLYASATDVIGDNGFLTPTNDRDVKLADVDQDGWLDMITSTTMSDDLTTLLGQPRVYMNLGEDVVGNWLGFRFENGRIPRMLSADGNSANPRGCALDVADVNDDGYPDIYIVDYDTPETSGTVCIDLNNDGDTNDIVDGVSECNESPAEDPSKDFNGKLLINQGATNPGFFTDTRNTRMTSTQLEMGFGNECAIRDVNGDGLLDIIRVNTLITGQDIAVLYQTPAGVWDGPITVTEFQPYGMNAADLNNDGRVDIVTADDGQDAYLINDGNDAQNRATWTRYTMPDSLNEFGNSIQFGDLDLDGWQDVIIADVDSDLGPFCPSSGRRMHIYRNTGDVANLLDEDGTVLPLWALASTYDSAPIDIDNDGYLDLVIGACYGMSVWMNRPPIGIEFEYPDGRPNDVGPGTPTSFDVNLTTLGGVLDETSPALVVEVDNEGPVSYALSGSGANRTATLPAFDCGDEIEYHFTAELVGGAQYRDPPTGTYRIDVATDLAVVFDDDMEGGDNGWTTDASGVTAGFWERADPIATTNGGEQYAPGEAASGDFCWVSQNGAPGGSAGAADLDGGPITLTSPTIDLGTTGGEVSFAWWLNCDDFGTSTGDALSVEMNDGSGWVLALEIASGDPGWGSRILRIEDHVSPTSAFQVRFRISDNPNNSITEVAIDDVMISQSECVSTPCPGDFNGDGIRDGADLGLLITAWGTAAGDLDGDGVTNGSDLGLLMTNFGIDC